MTNDIAQHVRIVWLLLVTVAAVTLAAAAAEPIRRHQQGRPPIRLAAPQLIVDDAIPQKPGRRPPSPPALHQNALVLLRSPVTPVDNTGDDVPADCAANPLGVGTPAPAGSRDPFTAPRGPAVLLSETTRLSETAQRAVDPDFPARPICFGHSEEVDRCSDTTRRTEIAIVGMTDDGSHHPGGADATRVIPFGHSDAEHNGPQRGGDGLHRPLPHGLVPPATRLANADSDARPWLAPYLERATRRPEQELFVSSQTTAEPQFSLVTPWWNESVALPLRQTPGTRETSVSDLLVSALTYSPHVLAVQTIPQIQQRVWVQENAAFDWHGFLEASWDDLNDPVGNALTTGNNATRFKDQLGSHGIGLRRRNPHGGELEVGQSQGWQQNNSLFLVPNPQTTARLELNYTQPLLNGAGREVNTSRIVLATIATHQAYDDLSEALQSHLLKVTDAYWELYLARALYLQRVRLLEEAEQIDEILRGREGVDSVPRQILRAQAEVADRRSSVVRAEASIRNAESRIRLLVSEPALYDLAHLELIPRELPATHNGTPPLSSALETALWSRPDISHAVRSLRATSVRLNVAKNKLLPTLDLVFGAYSAGLVSSNGFPGALGDEFSEGRPGYSIGFLFEVPLGNRAAKARYEQRQLEMNQAIQLFRLQMETAFTEVELAVREIETSYREMVSRSQALQAAQQEADYLLDRWLTFPGVDMATTLLLEDLLDAQVRLTLAEEAFARAQVDYSLSLVRVRVATGTLLNCEWNPPVASADQPEPGHLVTSDSATDVP